MSRTSKAPKTGGKAISAHCQNHGRCNHCVDNRTISSQRQASKSVEALREYLKNAPQEELDEQWERVKAMGLKGPTLTEYLATNPVWQLQLAEQQLVIARKALHEISQWSQQLQDTVVEYGTGICMWESQVTTALDAIRDMRALKRGAGT